MDYLALTVGEAAKAIRDGALTATRYADALLEQATAQRQLNAFITLDPDQVRAAARAADQAQAARGTIGPLHGVPLALKDNIDTVDLPTTGGTPALRNHRPGRNAPVADALLHAGAIVLGKTSLHELACGVTNNNGGFGAARNPWDRRLIPGGSSGGTGVAVAAHIAPGGIGSDTGGSVRIPAALCGIVGFRPTTKRWSQDGIIPISSTRDTAGPMTRSVADAILLDGVVTGGATALAPIPLNGLRFGVPREYYWSDIDSELGAVAEKELSRLSSLGVKLVEADVPHLLALDQAVSFPVALYEQVTTLRGYLRDAGTGISYEQVVAQCASPDVKGMLASLLGDGAVPEAVYREALARHRPALQAALEAYFKQHDLAAMIFPTTPMPARPIGEDDTVDVNGERMPTFFTYIRNTDPASNAALPGLSLPIGLTRGGLPAGIELDAPSGQDARLLAIGLAYEASLPPMPAPKF
jgi:indoleacetamide hydrolase